MSRTDSTPLFLVVALCASGCGYVCRDTTACPAIEGEGEIPRALEDAARYISRKPLRGDHAWFAFQGAALLGEPFDDWSKALYIDPKHARGGDGRMTVLGRALMPAPPPPPTRSSTPTIALPSALEYISAEDRERGFRVMAVAATCDRAGTDGAKELADLIRRRSTGYFANAQLWSAVTAFHLGCFDESVLAHHESRLLPRLHREAELDTGTHDLSAERAAILAYAGDDSLITPELVTSLIERQDPVGGWLDPYFDGGPYARPVPLHMSAVSFYVLARAWVEIDHD